MMAPSAGRAMLLALLWALVLVAAGHGVGPLALLLAMGAPEWRLPGALGWIGLALLGAAQLRTRAGDARPAARAMLHGAAIAFLAAAAAVAGARADLPWLTAMTALPFGWLALTQLVALIDRDDP